MQGQKGQKGQKGQGHSVPSNFILRVLAPLPEQNFLIRPRALYTVQTYHRPLECFNFTFTQCMLRICRRVKQI